MNISLHKLFILYAMASPTFIRVSYRQSFVDFKDFLRTIEEFYYSFQALQVYKDINLYFIHKLFKYKKTEIMLIDN